MDNTSGCQLYLSKESLGASVTTAKASEINVLVPGEEPNGDWVSFRRYLLFLPKDLACLGDQIRHACIYEL